MRKCVVACWIAVLFIFLLIDDSQSGRSGGRSSGGSRSSGSSWSSSSSRGRGSSSSRPSSGSRPSGGSKPSSGNRPSGGSKPSGGSRPSGGSKPGSSFPIKPGSSKPGSSPIKPDSAPIKPGSSPVKPGSFPIKPDSAPVKPGSSPVKPDSPIGNPPPYNPAYPQNPAHPPQNPAYPPQKPHFPQNPPPYNPAYPQNPAYPPQNPAHPPQHYPQNPAYPPQNPGYPQNPAHPPQYPPQNPAYPPQNPNYPQNPAHPPPYPGQPPQYPGQPPQYPGQPPPYPGHPPPYPGQPPPYPGHHPQYPGQPAPYPGHPPPYPGHRPQYPGQPPQHPGYPVNPGFPSHTGGGNWGHYDSKPWKPKKPKTSHMVGSALAGAAAGAVGGYLLGNAMSNLRFRFHNPAEERWWYENRNRYPDQVYYPQYNQPIVKDVFVRDCINITVREYVEPTGNQTADEMETTVVTRVVREMCTEQYRLVSGAADGGSWSRSNPEPWKPKTPTLEMPQVAKETVTTGPRGAVVGPLLGSPMSNMSFQFNNSDEERWWYENRNNYSDQVYYLEYSQPVLQDVFVGDCMNITLEKFLEPTGNQARNQTVDEMEEKVVKQVVHKMCTQQYWLVLGTAGGGSLSQQDSEPWKSKAIKPEMQYVEEEPALYVTVAVIASNRLEGAPSHPSFSKADQKSFDSGITMLLANPFLLWINTFAICFLTH